MLRKIVLTFLFFVVTGTIALGIFARRAPALLRTAIEQALDKPVTIGAIEYRFPASFDIAGFEIRDNAPFAGEITFKADRIRVHASPLGFSKRRLIIDEIEVDGASIHIRKLKGRLYHALSSVAGNVSSEVTAPSTVGNSEKPGSSAPIEIGRFHLINGHFEFIDYDVAEGGFVTALDGIHVDVRHVALPLDGAATSYVLTGKVSQGRDQEPADFNAKGWTRFTDLDTDARFDVKGLFLPYFRPYYGTVTPALIRSGALDSKAILKIEKKQLTANADFEIVGLLFEGYEGGDELFGLNADQMISFLKDSSGRLRFQVAADWNLADPSARPRDVIRRSIEKSLKRTLFGNVGNIVSNAYKRYADTDDDPSATGKTKTELQEAISKVKDFFDR